MKPKAPPSLLFRLDAATWPEFEREAKKAGMRRRARYAAYVWAKNAQAHGRYWLSAHQAVAAWVLESMHIKQSEAAATTHEAPPLPLRVGWAPTTSGPAH